VALAEPRGPVYLTLPREVLANPDLGDADAPAVAAPVIAEPQPSPSHVETVAEWIAAADWPLIVTSHVGRDLAAAAALAELAETFALPVVVAGPTCVSLPASHPMSLGQSGGRLLPKADVIVVVDAEVPWFPRAFSPAPGVKVAHLGIDPLWSRYPIRSFPADVAIPGSPRTALRLLVDALAAQRADSGRIAARRAQMAAHRAELDAQRARALADARTAVPIRYDWLGECVREALPPGGIVVTELGAWPHQLALDEPGSLIGVGIGGGLGFALGASLGAKLAAPERTVITTVGDGSY